MPPRPPQPLATPREAATDPRSGDGKKYFLTPSGGSRSCATETPAARRGRRALPSVTLDAWGCMCAPSGGSRSRATALAFSPDPPQNPNKTRLFFTSPTPPRASSPPQPRPLSPRSPDLHVNKPPLPILSILLILSKHSLPLLPIYTAKNRRLPPLTRRGNYAIISVV